MKSFIIKNKKLIMYIAIVAAFVMIFTTAELSVPKKSYNEIIDNIKTCSVPEGKVISEGIDVSRYQGEIDFEKVKASGYDFVIIRVGTSQGGKDRNFDKYYNDALSAGLDIGCYYYTYSTTAEEAKAEALDVLSYIEGKSFTYPVFFDFEHGEHQAYHRTEENTAMINTFCKYIKRGGYYPGVYTSSSIYKSYINIPEVENKWDFWVASYRDYTYSYDGFSKNFSMWQYSNIGRVDGINADVDLNVCYVDYPKIIEQFNKTLIKYTKYKVK